MTEVRLYCTNCGEIQTDTANCKCGGYVKGYVAPQGGLLRGHFSRAFRLGSGPYGDVWVSAKWDGKRLSMSGVEGRGSFGQIGPDIREAIDKEAFQIDPKWTLRAILKLLSVWERWHLNDMRPGCEHQRAEDWDSRPIDPSKPLRSYGRHFEGQTQDSWNMLSWVTRAEHPKGLLGEPCPTCGYRYGSAWLVEDIPADVLVWLANREESAGCPWNAL